MACFGLALDPKLAPRLISPHGQEIDFIIYTKVSMPKLQLLHSPFVSCIILYINFCDLCLFLSFMHWMLPEKKSGW
jgi:hypothetical protein